MDKIDKSANDLIMIAYKTGGRIPYHYTDKYNLTSDELSKVNTILRRYGTFEGKLFESWEWYQLNSKGIELCENGGLKEERCKKRDFWENRTIRIIGIVVAILTFLLTLLQFVRECTPSLQEKIPPTENWLI